MTTRTYTGTCLSPLHVGTGVQFGRFEGVYDNGQWYRVDLDRVLARHPRADELARAMSNRDFAWEPWLRDRGIAPADVALYHLPCPCDPDEGLVREGAKDIHQQPCLAGSTIKGAIRTAVVWTLVRGNADLLQAARDNLLLRIGSLDLLRAIDETPGEERRFSDRNVHLRAVGDVFGVERAEELCQILERALGKSADNFRRSDFERFAEWNRRREQVEPNPRSADDPIEKLVLGANPNHDLMRAIHVGDSTSVGIDKLAVGLVWTCTLRNERLVEKRQGPDEFKTFVEWLTPGTALTLSLKTDPFLFSPTAARELRFDGTRQGAVDALAETCNSYAQAVIHAERDFYAMHGPEAVSSFYGQLAAVSAALPDGAFLLNVGWGGGWSVKTIGDVVQGALGDDDFEKLREHYRLGRNPRTRRIDFGSPFPKTRRVAYINGVPRCAMGWLVLTPQEASHVPQIAKLVASLGPAEGSGTVASARGTSTLQPDRPAAADRRSKSSRPESTHPTPRLPSLPRPGEKLDAVLLEERTRKGGWKAKHLATGLSGPIQNSTLVPTDKKPGETVTLIVKIANPREMAFAWPT